MLVELPHRIRWLPVGVLCFRGCAFRKARAATPRSSPIRVTICLCSFFATLPDTKIPRWPMLWCSSPTIAWPCALISSVEPYTSVTQLNACCGGVMLSPIEANRMIGDLTSRRSKASSHRSLTACPEVVSDEKVLDDPLDLFAIHQVVAAPPALELEEARWLGIDWRTRGNIPEGVRRVQVLEVLHQVGAVELADAQVSGKRGIHVPPSIPPA